MTVAYWRRLNTLDWKAETGPTAGSAGRTPRAREMPTPSTASSQNRVVPVAATETVIKLARTLRVSGTVVDFRTREPIGSFILTPGTESDDGSYTYWDK